ncbi:MAG: DNA mismatch endonuclease Vsr [Mesorhizobium sp.]|nr:MAG: DNA mismatch endonuclease Vsr [Mesorhizobium sp.]
MADTLSAPDRSERMSRIRGTNTKPELVVRKIAHSLGFRYRVHRRDLAGTPDLVFVTKRKVIFVHGCFWHRHTDSDCKLARLPKSRLDFWLPKLEGNAERDNKNQEKLKQMGWDVLVIWECQIKNCTSLPHTIQSFLRT